MSQVFKRQDYCPHCQANVLAERTSGISDGMGCLISLLTLGLFLPFFLLARIAADFRPYLCPHCGSPLKSDSKGWLGVALLILAVIHHVHDRGRGEFLTSSQPFL